MALLSYQNLLRGSIDLFLLFYLIPLIGMSEAFPLEVHLILLYFITILLLTPVNFISEGARGALSIKWTVLDVEAKPFVLKVC